MAFSDDINHIDMITEMWVHQALEEDIDARRHSRFGKTIQTLQPRQICWKAKKSSKKGNNVSINNIFWKRSKMTHSKYTMFNSILLILKLLSNYNC